MKNVKYILMALLMALAFYGRAIAATDIYDDGYWRTESDGDHIPLANKTHDIGSTTYYVDNIYADDLIIADGQERSIMLPLMEFYLNDLTSVTEATTSTAPGYECDNYGMALVWSDGETTAASVTFRVPADYKSGGAFRVFCDESSSTTPNQIDFAVYVDKDGQTWDTTVSNQTPAALIGTAGTPDMVTLSVSTDFTSLAVGDTVRLHVWRDDTAEGTGDLEMYYAEFYYTSER